MLHYMHDRHTDATVHVVGAFVTREPHEVKLVMLCLGVGISYCAINSYVCNVLLVVLVLMLLGTAVVQLLRAETEQNLLCRN